MPEKRGPTRGAQMPEGVRPWRDIWSAGHSAGLIDDVASAAELVDRLVVEFEATASSLDWRRRLDARSGDWTAPLSPSAVSRDLPAH